jgi:DNA-binding Lrp family transcriptional regulator
MRKTQFQFDASTKPKKKPLVDIRSKVAEAKYDTYLKIYRAARPYLQAVEREVYIYISQQTVSYGKNWTEISINDMSAATGYSKRAIIDATKHLAGMKLIEDYRAEKRKGVVKQYAIVFYNYSNKEVRSELEKFLKAYNAQRGEPNYPTLPVKVRVDKYELLLKVSTKNNTSICDTLDQIVEASPLYLQIKEANS